MTPVSSAYPARVRKRLVSDLDTAYYPDKPIVPYMEIVHDRAVLEVMRGCQRACRFCHAGTVYRPVRERSVAVLKRQADTQLKNTGYDEISLASLSTLDYSGVSDLVKHLVKIYGDRGIGVSLPSLRVDAFSIDLANEVQKVRKTTLTLAPEAGTQRLRDVINKNVTEEDLFQAAEAAFSSGWNSIKLYFMIGLPTETEADLDGVLDLLARVKAIGQRHSRRAIEVRASLACFVPKAHTPFQWRAQNSIAELEAKRRYLTSRKMKNVKLSFHDSRTSMLEGVIARETASWGRSFLRPGRWAADSMAGRSTSILTNGWKPSGNVTLIQNSMCTGSGITSSCFPGILLIPGSTKTTWSRKTKWLMRLFPRPIAGKQGVSIAASASTLGSAWM